MPTNESVNEALAGLSKGGQVLGLKFGDKVIEKPGEYVPKAQAQSSPEISFPNPDGHYVVVCLDMDAPFPSFGVLGPINHWIQSHHKPSDASQHTLTSGDTPHIVDYIGPAPPPGSAPHRYAFFLYEQPNEFDLEKHAPANRQKVPALRRMRHDHDAKEKELGLGKIIACNYILSN